MVDVEEFRADVRSWIGENAPAGLVGIGPYEYSGGRKPEMQHPDSKKWADLCLSRGLTAPSWPKEYGGGGLSPKHERVWREELAKAKVPVPLGGFGMSMIGPTLVQFGTEEQKDKHLRKIISGEIRWCQGYSEPNAGSDLAAVATSAKDDGDEYIINGQKIWTSTGDKADWMFLLVRTNTEVKKQAGITFVLLDIAQPGVEIRPILLISGASPFCETFFTDARAKKADIITKENNGWTVAKALLGHERTMIGNVFGGSGPSGGNKGEKPKNPYAEMGKHYVGTDDAGRVADPLLRDRVTQLTMDTTCFTLTVNRNSDSMKAGHKPGPETSLFKVYGTELNQRREELMLAIRGNQALGWEGEGYDGAELAQTRAWLRSRGNTIEGGTSEVQLNIIAKRVLMLPD